MTENTIPYREKVTKFWAID